MHLPTATTTSLSSIEAYHSLAREATAALSQEFQAVEDLYIKLLERYRGAHDSRVEEKHVEDLIGWRGEEVVEEVTLGLSGMQIPQDGCVVEGEPAVDGEYIQVIIDCASLKVRLLLFIYSSFPQLINVPGTVHP
jgi:hypothetical protein